MSAETEGGVPRRITRLTGSWIAERLENIPEGAVALFDIDSTVMDTAPRNFHILREAAQEIPRLRAVAEAVGPEDFGWSVFGPVQERISLTDEEKRKLEEFWRARFFSGSYVHYDRPYPGVAKLLTELRNRGMKIVYLTGRDEPNMSAGTRDSFAEHSLPVGPGSRFVFKPTAEEADLPFKERACAALAAEAKVLLAVENEPANANMMRIIFPEAVVALIDTVTSPHAVEPAEGIVVFSVYADSGPGLQ